MKKLFFAAFALVAGVLSAQAQTEIHPRIEVGANFASGVHKVVGTTPESKVRLGFRASLATEVGLASGVYLAPGGTSPQERGRHPRRARLRQQGQRGSPSGP